MLSLGPSQLESAISFTLQCFIYMYSLFHIRTASAIMVLCKRMHVRSYSMCIRIREQTLQHARQGRTLDYSPIEWQQLMLVSFVQAVVACNATALRVCKQLVMMCFIRMSLDSYHKMNGL